MYRQIALVHLFLCLAIRLSVAEDHHHPCKRECHDDVEPPRTCRYDFALDYYASMSTHCGRCPHDLGDCFAPGCVPAEGLKKGLFLVNEMLPGPSIEVCKGDRIVVDLRNELLLETTSIHWHGVRQRKTPFMDGVPYVTQCPVSPGHSFTYDFVADEPGSYFWHSHSSEQRSEGVFGALIVRARNDPQKSLYDRDEHAIIVTDWSSKPGGEILAVDVHVAELTRPHTLLVNGLGRYDSNTEMPLAVFRVEKGSRHRIRLINAGSQDCPVDVSIDNHTMLVIGSDANDVEPVEVDALRSMAGERYDIVVSADRPVDNYWIRFRGRDGSVSACDITGAHQLAVLRYVGAPEVDPTAPVMVEVPSDPLRRLLNPYDKGTETPGAIAIPTLNSLDKRDHDESSSRDRADYQFYLAYNDLDADEIAKLKGRRAMWQINNINFKTPSFPLLTQHRLIGDGLLCNADTLRGNNCSVNFCACTHTLEAKLNSLVELVIVDQGARKFNHPVHLHGYQFRVVAMRQVSNSTAISVDDIKKMDERGKIERKLKNAPLKDTVMVPSGGYTIVRFYADNPGYWLFHCHYEMHADLGMALVLKIGEHEEFHKPPDGFPECSSP